MGQCHCGQNQWSCVYLTSQEIKGTQKHSYCVIDTSLLQLQSEIFNFKVFFKFLTAHACWSILVKGLTHQATHSHLCHSTQATYSHTSPLHHTLPDLLLYLLVTYFHLYIWISNTFTLDQLYKLLWHKFCFGQNSVNIFNFHAKNT